MEVCSQDLSWNVSSVSSMETLKLEVVQCCGTAAQCSSISFYIFFLTGLHCCCCWWHRFWWCLCCQTVIIIRLLLIFVITVANVTTVIATVVTVLIVAICSLLWLSLSLSLLSIRSGVVAADFIVVALLITAVIFVVTVPHSSLSTSSPVPSRTSSYATDRIYHINNIKRGFLLSWNRWWIINFVSCRVK